MAPSGDLQVVARLYGYMPTGVAASRDNRIFLCFPRWDDGMLYTVGELSDDGQVKPYPGRAVNLPDPESPEDSLFSVQGLTVDALNRLWLLDTGRIRQGPVYPGAAKLVAVDLFSNEIVKTIVFPLSEDEADTYLNDVRIDLSRGEQGWAYVTDSGRGALLTVDLADGNVLRWLEGHPSVQPDELQLVVEGRPFGIRPIADARLQPLKVAADGIALAPDGAMVYYCPLSSRRLYAVPTGPLRAGEQHLALAEGHVTDLGPKPAVDGMVADDRGRVYLTAYEHNAIMRRLRDGTLETVVQDPRLLWPDSLAIGPDGFLYITANQFHRQAAFNGGKDLRRRPFVLFRTPTDAGPVMPAPARPAAPGTAGQ